MTIEEVTSYATDTADMIEERVALGHEFRRIADRLRVIDSELYGPTLTPLPTCPPPHVGRATRPPTRLLPGLVGIFLSAIVGCQTTPTPSPAVATPELARNTSTHIQAASVAVGAAAGETKKLPETPVKGAISAHLGTATTELVAAGASAKATEEGAVKDADKAEKQQDRIAELEASDPVRTWFRWIGGCLVVIAVAGGVAAAFLRNSTIATASIAAVAAGFALLAIAAFLKAILLGALLVLVGTLAVASAWGLWRWRANHNALISTQTAIAVINPTEPQREVLKKIQTPDAEAVFRKVVKPKVVK
jgi:hypothetical protein